MTQRKTPLPKEFNDITGGLNLTQSSQIPDKDFVIARNMIYNNAKQLQSRRGIRAFGNPIGSAPIPSIFFFQRDDNQTRNLICISGGQYYTYNETTENRTAVPGFTIMEYETLPGMTAKRARADFAVYKNTAYIGDGVNPYASRDGTTFTQIGIAAGVTGSTFDNTTDVITKAAHGLTTGMEIFRTGAGLPTGITQYQVYYVITVTVNTFQISTSKNGTAVNFTTNGSGTMTFYRLTEPRVRYIQYLGDRLYGAGDDANPISLYYTNAAPTDGTNLDQNTVIIGGDETGIINGLNEYSQLVLAIKSNKIYGVNVATPSVDPIDSQTGGYSDRTFHTVGNGLAYLNERGIDTLALRDGVSGASAVTSKPLSEKVRQLTKNIIPTSYNSNTAQYIKTSNNYYFSFDTDGDDIPDTTLVYSSLVKAFTEVEYQNIYDYGQFINADGEVQHLFTSAVGGQVYQHEYGFDDDGVAIDTELQTGARDFGRPGTMKVFGFVDVIGYKQLGGEIPIDILVDGESVAGSTVTDAFLSETSSFSLGVTPIGEEELGSGEADGDDLPMYKFIIRVPMFERGYDIAVNMSASGVQRIFEKMSIEVDTEEVEVFNFANIG